MRRHMALIALVLLSGAALALASTALSCKEQYSPTDFLPPAVQKALDEIEGMMPGARYQLVVAQERIASAPLFHFFLLDTQTGEFRQGAGFAGPRSVFIDISWQEQGEPIQQRTGDPRQSEWSGHTEP